MKRFKIEIRGGKRGRLVNFMVRLDVVIPDCLIHHCEVIENGGEVWRFTTRA